MKALFVDIFDDTYIFTKDGFELFYTMNYLSFDDILSLEEIDYVKASYDMFKILQELDFYCDVDNLNQAFESVISGKDEEWVDIECNDCYDDDDEDFTGFNEKSDCFRIYSYEVELDDFYNYD